MKYGQRLLRWMRALGHRADTANEDDDDMHSERPDRRSDPIDVNVNFIDGNALQKLGEIARSIHQLKELLMATAAEFTAGFERVNVATTAIAALIRVLIERQQSGSMTDAEETAAQDQLLAIADTLEAMAATPTDPVPVPVPAP